MERKTKRVGEVVAQSALHSSLVGAEGAFVQDPCLGCQPRAKPEPPAAGIQCLGSPRNSRFAMCSEMVSQRAQESFFTCLVAFRCFLHVSFRLSCSSSLAFAFPSFAFCLPVLSRACFVKERRQEGRKAGVQFARSTLRPEQSTKPGTNSEPAKANHRILDHLRIL